MSWKQYGGTRNIETNRQFTTNTIIADEMILKKSYIGGFTIHGVLDVTGKAIIQGNLEVDGKVSIQDISVNILRSNSSFLNNIDSVNNINCINDTIIGNSLISKNIKVNNNITIGNTIFLNGNQFIYSDFSGIGINTFKPMSSFDILCTSINGLHVYSDFSKNINILSSNYQNKGIVITTSDEDTDHTGSNVHLDFYVNNDIDVNKDGDAFIKCKDSGVFEISAKERILASSNFSISNRSDKISKNIFNESVVIYDNLNGIYNKEIYKNNLVHTGDGLTIVTGDNLSNSTLRIVTPEKVGLGIIGGVYPNDTSRSMSKIGLTDTSGIFIPNQTIISGSNPAKYKSTLGINTYKPITDKYVVDINGPIHIDNGDINIVNISDFEIKSMDSYENMVIAVGSPTDISSSIYTNIVLISYDYGSKWISNDLSGNIIIYSGGTTLNDINNIGLNYTLNDVFIYDISNAFIVGNNNLILTSNDGGIKWFYINFSYGNNFYNFKQIFVYDDLIDNPTYFEAYIYGYTNVDISNNNNFLKFQIYKSLLYNLDNLNNDNYQYINTNTLYIKDISNIYVNSVDIYRDINGNKKSYFATNSGIWQMDIYTNDLIQIIDTSLNKYNTVKTYGSKIIGIGNKICSILDYSNNNYPNLYSLNKLYIYDDLKFLSVSNKKQIVYTSNGGITWNPIDNAYINPSGKEQIITDISNISNILMTNKDSILVSDVKKIYSQYLSKGNSSLINLFVPKLFNSLNNNLLDISGNMIVSGDIFINDGELKSNNNTFNLLNENVENLYIGGNSNLINIGNTISGNSNILTNLNVYKNTLLIGNLLLNGIQTITNTTESGNISTGAFIINGGIGISGNTNIGGNLFINSETTLNGNVLMNSNLLVNSNLSVNGNVLMNSNLSVNGIQIIGNTTESTNSYTGALIINGGVGISGNTNINGNLNIGKNTLLSGNLSLNGVQRITNITESNGTTSGALTISGGIGISGNTNIGGNLNVNKNTILNGNLNIISNNPLSINTVGGILSNQLIETKQDLIFGLILKSTFFSSTVTNLPIQFNDGKYISDIFVRKNLDNIVDDISGQKNFKGTINIQNITDVSNNTGALFVSGGVGIQKQLIVNGNLLANGTLTTNGTLTANGNINLYGNIGIGKLVNSNYKVDISGNINIDGTLNTTSIKYTDSLNIYSDFINNTINIGNRDNIINEQVINFGKNASQINFGESSKKIEIGTNDVSGNGSMIVLGGGSSAYGEGVGIQTIAIGGKNTITTIYGNVQFANQNASLSDVINFSNKFIFKDNSLNVVIANLYNPGPLSGAGIYFQGFNSVTDLAQFTISRDVQAFVFKSPTYTTKDDYDNDLTKSRQNILRLDVNNLTLNQTNTNGLVILKRLTNDLDGSEFSITGTNFDISNIFIKDKDQSITGSTQSISTDVILKGNTYFNNNIMVNKTTITGNAILDINGNAIISRLGIGTSSVNINPNSLEIQGNMYQTNNGSIIQF